MVEKDNLINKAKIKTKLNLLIDLKLISFVKILKV